MENLKKLLLAINHEPTLAATESEIAQFEADIGLKLPDLARDLFLTCNGIALGKRLKLLSLKESLNYFRGLRDAGISQRWGYIPLVDNNDSNPLCICCNEPLTGYLVEVAHDDSSIVRFHSLDSFFRQLTAPSTDHQWNIANISADFDHPERTAHDIVTGKSLLWLADQLDDAERNDCYRFAIWLLSDQHVKEIAALFQHADEYVREDARRRLKAMQTPESKQALKIYDDEFEQFAQKCVAIFKKAGLRASVVNHSGLHIEISLNLSMLYAKRNDPDLVNFLFAPIVRNMPNAANDSKE